MTEKLLPRQWLLFFGNTATYLHGASSDIYRDVMGPFALHWQAMRDAREQGCSFYDFGGVNGATFQSEKWEGITRFKVGFSEKTEIIQGYS